MQPRRAPEGDARLGPRHRRRASAACRADDLPSSFCPGWPTSTACTRLEKSTSAHNGYLPMRTSRSGLPGARSPRTVVVVGLQPRHAVTNHRCFFSPWKTLPACRKMSRRDETRPSVIEMFRQHVTRRPPRQNVPTRRSRRRAEVQSMLYCRSLMPQGTPGRRARLQGWLAWLPGWLARVLRVGLEFVLEEFLSALVRQGSSRTGLLGRTGVLLSVLIPCPAGRPGFHYAAPDLCGFKYCSTAACERASRRCFWVITLVCWHSRATGACRST